MVSGPTLDGTAYSSRPLSSEVDCPFFTMVTLYVWLRLKSRGAGAAQEVICGYPASPPTNPVNSVGWRISVLKRN